LVAKNSLPRSIGLKARRSIEELFREGRRIRQSSFLCIWQRCDRFEFAVFVSRDSGSAVQRNRIKRRLREAVRLARRELTNPVRLGLVPNRDTLQAGLERIQADVKRTIDEINRATE